MLAWDPRGGGSVAKFPNLGPRGGGVGHQIVNLTARTPGFAAEKA